MSDQKKVRVAIIGVGNCASSLVQGVQYYRNAKDDDMVPGLMHVNLGGYHVRDIEFTAAFDVVDTKVGLDLSEAIFAYPNNTYKFTDVPIMNVPVYRGMTHDGLGKYLSRDRQEGARTDRGYRRHPEGHQDRCGGQLPAGRLRDGDQVVRGAGAGGRLRLRQLHPGVHRQPGVLGEALPRARPADHRRRHQEPGGRHHHAPRADQPVRRPRRAPRSHLPAQLRRQHRFPQHARARAAGIQEDLQDRRGDQHAALHTAARTMCTWVPATTCRG